MNHLRLIPGQPLSRSGWICQGCFEKVSRRRYSKAKNTLNLQSHSADPEQTPFDIENQQNGGAPSSPPYIQDTPPGNEYEHLLDPFAAQKPIKIAKVQPYHVRAEPKDNHIRKRLRSSLDILDPHGGLTQSKIRFHSAEFHIRTTASAPVRYVKFQYSNQPEEEPPREESRLRIQKYGSTSTPIRNHSSKDKPSNLSGATTMHGGLKGLRLQRGIPGGRKVPSSRSLSTSARVLGLSSVAPGESQTHQTPLHMVNPNIHERLRQFQRELDDADAARKATLGILRPLQSVDLHSIDLENGLGEDQLVQEDEQDITIEDTTSFLRPKIMAGDLIEIYMGGVPSLAVVTAIYKTAAGLQHQIVTSVGSWEHKVFTFRSTPTFVVRNYFKSSELARIKQFLPNSSTASPSRNQKQDEGDLVPTQISHSVTKKLQAFQKEADNVYRLHATNIDTVFELLGKQDEAVFMRLEDITRKALRIKESPRHEALYAVHKACTQYSASFLPGKDHWYFRNFELLSKKELKVVEQVRIWVREHSDLAISKSNGHRLDEVSVLDEFAKEVHPVILESRKGRECLMGAHLGPFQPLIGESSTAASPGRIITGKQISPNGSIFLSFIKLWAERVFDSPGSMILTALGSVVMKSISLYDDDLLARCRRESLSLVKECGIVPPWQMHGDRGSRLSNPYQDANSLITKLFSQARTEVETGQHQTDLMQELRHDWGDMPVYCIDSASTTEVDDGVSLEETPESGTYWIHVHVANPTAFISLNSRVDTLARELGHTVYLPHRMDRMLPFDVLREKLSLHSGCPTITFSTKINTEGEVLDRQVRNGRIHNVLHITPETVAGHTEEPISSVTSFNTYIVGSPVEKPQLTKHVTSTLAPNTISALKILKKLGDAWVGLGASVRRQTWQVNFNPRASVEVRNLDLVDVDQGNFRQFLYDPTIIYSAQPWSPYSRAPVSRHSGRDLVQSMMQMANNTAAEWCSQRGIPTLFRGCVVNELKDLGAEVAQPLRRSGQLSTDFEEFCRRFSTPMLDMKATLSSQKSAHEVIGVNAYTWVTSPLRRYEDMVSHWQIEAALRREARTGRQMTEYDTSSLPFSREMIKKQMSRTTETSVNYSWQSSQSEKYWITEFLIRGALFGECPSLPDMFTLYITSSDKDYLQGYVAEIGSRASVSTKYLDHAENLPRAGQIWKAKPDKGDLRTSAISWKLVERIA